MTFNKKIAHFAIAIVAILASSMIFSQIDPASMKHFLVHGVPASSVKTTAILTESGTDPFATVQEIIAQLEANPNTNWEKVNIEALRLHLVQMQDMIMNVKVSQQSIKNGFQAVVVPTTDRALKSMISVLSAHPAQLRAETGWDMQVSRDNKVFTLTVTVNNPKKVSKIRGLGYVGIMAYGRHHPAHHWAIASGNNPHVEHGIKH